MDIVKEVMKVITMAVLFFLLGAICQLNWEILS